MNDQHQVRATRDGRFWLVSIDGRLATQAYRLRDVEMMARDHLSLKLGQPEGEIDVVLTVDLPDETRLHVERASSLRDEAAALQAQSAHESALAARSLKEMGLTYREIGPLLGVSHQRAQQLVASS